MKFNRVFAVISFVGAAIPTKEHFLLYFVFNLAAIASGVFLWTRNDQT